MHLTAPLHLDEFSSLMDSLGPFEHPPAVAVAVSGGADSLALCLLMVPLIKTRGGRMLALTVDHGLRPESSAEAQHVHNILQQRGIAHRILSWTGEKPTSHLQASARAARYRLLSQACLEEGILHLATAHHLDDQIETVLMRQQKHSDDPGLAGMSAQRTLPHGRLIRPLLSVPRARLRAVCEAHGLEWIEDPSNADPRFTRVRIRQELRASPVEESFLKTLKEKAESRRHEEAQQALLLGQGAAIYPEGWMTLARNTLTPPLLRRAVYTISGDLFPPRREQVARALETLLNKGKACTLAGCVLMPRTRQVVVCREPALCEGKILTVPGQETLWDGRFLIAPMDQPFFVGALGQTGWAAVKKALPQRHPAFDWPAAVRQTLPALWREDSLQAVPHLSWAEGFSPPPVQFYPTNPLAGELFTPIYGL